jgi:hypothetical protein
MALRNFKPIKSATLSSWDELVRYETVQLSGKAPMVYRGQKEESWGLTPSLTRELNRVCEEETAMIDREKELLRSFKKAAHLYLDSRHLPATNGLMGWWATMQHHGAPTRLLDWTKSFFVALYFAAEDASTQDGAVWCLEPNRLRTETGSRSGFYGFDDLASPGFEDLVYGDHRTWLAVAEPEVQVERMVAQQGCFTVSNDVLFSHDSVLGRLTIDSDSSESVLSKIIIPADSKPEILKRLLRLNISARTLFPGLDGYSRSMVDEIRSDEPIPRDSDEPE